VVRQVRGEYQTKHPRMRAYRNVVLDYLQNFVEYSFPVVPRRDNVVADALAASASDFEIPNSVKCKYKVEVRHRPVVSNNMKH